MNILFDQNVPKPLRRYVIGHLVSTAYTMGWDRKVKGELLQLAEPAGFGVFVTGDQQLSYQQNLARQRIAIVELTDNKWTIVKPHVESIAAAGNACLAGSYIRVNCGR